MRVGEEHPEGDSRVYNSQLQYFLDRHGECRLGWLVDC